MYENIQILGFRANIESVGDVLDFINDLKSEGEVIQLLNADAIAGKKHVVHAVHQAFLAFERGDNLANDISVEIALRCSGQRQISKAFKIVGLHEGEMNLCVVLIDCEDYKNQLSSVFIYDSDVLNPDEEYLFKIYDIGESEMDICDLIIDKITRLIVDY